MNSFSNGIKMTDASTAMNIAVKVKGLSVQFGDFYAVKNISFNVSRGEIFGFLGANGAGKTTTIRVLCGILIPTHGSIWVAGVGLKDGTQAIKSKVGYMSQKFTLYNDLTVEENLNFAAALRKLDPKTYLNRRKELLDFISFDKSLTSKVQDLPGGTKQQVSLAAALLHDPEIVFLDEPTAGVSPAARERFWSLIRQIAAQEKTVFVTSHYMDEVEQCGRIALMREGEIIGLDTPSGLKKSTFPKTMYEFDPKESLSFSEISALGQNELFSFFEPYGLRFHASIADESQWERFRPELEKKFNIKPILPTLEDVFIKKVEKKS
jgi:ABC-2 type transport system ATP-binding protein